MTREEIQERIWEQASESLLGFTTREEFLEALGAWGIVPWVVDGETIGGLMTQGPVFHFFTFKRKVPITRQVIMAFLKPQLDEYGYVITKTPIDLKRQHRFNKSFGFVKVGEDEYDVHYKLEKNTCPQLQ